MLIPLVPCAKSGEASAAGNLCLIPAPMASAKMFPIHVGINRSAFACEGRWLENLWTYFRDFKSEKKVIEQE